MFESLPADWTTILASREVPLLCRKFCDAHIVLLAGNGGSLSTASHAAADISRNTGKQAIALESPILMSALANDHGYDESISAWLKLNRREPTKTLFLAFSGSGTSRNVMHGLRQASNMGMPAALVTAATGDADGAAEFLKVTIPARGYHDYEVMSLMLVYLLIHSTGSTLPLIP